MRPVRLATRALGPYPDELILDFRVLEDRTLFLIHGPTGAGKTTILDAISFALYGACSGNERDVKRIRSDHADPSFLTEVTFDFRLGSDDYRIYRRPEQQRPKKRGEGTTAVRAEAQLWKRTGLRDDTDDGKPIAAQWNRVTEAVEKLLGFRSDQFGQVVMLPQGQFRKLLLVDSKERQAILEVLFQTELYRRIEEGLKQAAKDLATDLKTKTARREFILEQAGSESAEHLVHIYESVKAKAVVVRAGLKRLKIMERESQENLNRGRANLEKLDELKRSRLALLSLQERIPEFDKKKLILGDARKAAAIAGDERSLEQRQAESELADKKLKAAREALKTATIARDEAEELLAVETARQPELEETQRGSARLHELTQRVRELTEARERLAIAKEADIRADELLGIAKRKVEDYEGQIESGKKHLEEAKEKAGLLETLRMKTVEAERLYNQRKKLADRKKEQTDLEKRLAETTSRLDKAEKDAAKALSEQRSLETAWMECQAAILSAGLRSGAPCPVCGSTEHPRPARSDLELPNERLLKAKAKEAERLRAVCDEVTKEKIRLETTLSGLQSAEAELLDTLGDSAGRDLAELGKELNRTTKEMTAAEEAAMRVSQLEEQLSQLNATLAEAGRKTEKALKQKVDAEAAQVKARAEVDTLLSGIPQDLQEMAALNRAKVRAAKKERQLKEAFEKASKQLAQANEKVSAGNASVEAAQDAATLAARRTITAREQLAASLSKAEFRDQDHFKASKRTYAEIQDLENGIDEFFRGLAAAADRSDRAAKNAEGLEVPDMKSLDAAAAQAKSDLEEALREAASLDKEIERIEGLTAELNKVTADLDTLEARYAVVGRIAEVAGGGNREGITFQRFVLASLLDDVLFSASDRLKIMSNGRYALQRVTVRTDRRTSFGLDLEVEDAYTGTARPVSTLSGGESFLASLSLALGLADVVQTYAGGIHLDTMFVDEGFGSLDPEALDLAFRALVDLQRNGRLVGIISHVPELRERIDTRLEVSTNRRGSQARFVVG